MKSSNTVDYPVSDGMGLSLSPLEFSGSGFNSFEVTLTLAAAALTNSHLAEDQALAQCRQEKVISRELAGKPAGCAAVLFVVLLIRVTT